MGAGASDLEARLAEQVSAKCRADTAYGRNVYMRAAVTACSGGDVQSLLRIAGCYLPRRMFGSLLSVAVRYSYILSEDSQVLPAQRSGT